MLDTPQRRLYDLEEIADFQRARLHAALREIGIEPGMPHSHRLPPHIERMQARLWQLGYQVAAAREVVRRLTPSL